MNNEVIPSPGDSIPKVEHTSMVYSSTSDGRTVQNNNDIIVAHSVIQHSLMFKN